MPEEIKKTTTTPETIQEGLKPSDRSRKTRKTASAKHDRMQGKKIKEKKKIKEALLVFSESAIGGIVGNLFIGNTHRKMSAELTHEGLKSIREWAAKIAGPIRITTMLKPTLQESASTTGFLKTHPNFAIYIAYLHIRGWKMARAAMAGQGHAEFHSGGGHNITIDGGKWKIEHHGADVSGNTPEDLEDELNRQMI